MNFHVWPSVNAFLNAMAGVFLLLGFIAIKEGKRARHRQMMINAFVCSAVFLISYLAYHFFKQGITRYQATGMLKYFYLLILGTHSALAILIVPFILMAIRHALRGEYERHKRITRWLYPTWMYVSVTGVLVYLMLYIFPAG